MKDRRQNILQKTKQKREIKYVDFQPQCQGVIYSYMLKQFTYKNLMKYRF